MVAIDFQQAFGALTGNSPFPWQQELYQRFLQRRIPASCNLPTGLGKTAIIPIWLLALANSDQGRGVPRRLVYVVNRRTVVDQATREAEKMRANLSQAPNVAAALKKLCATGSEHLLAISTLRGQFADNREWSADPSRPAVIVGTVDMIGSRLLFNGYGIGFKSKPLHAGFLGQDALLVHDEAHLEPAFQKLLVAIQCEQHGGRLNDRCECIDQGKRTTDLRPFRVMALSATSRSGGDVFELTQDEQAGKVEAVRVRIEAKKTIALHEIDDEKKLADEVAELALIHKDSKRAILVFVRKVEDVGKVVKRLPAGSFQQLTGTLRGLERDKLATEDPIFRRFLPKAEARDETVYLVCTSAGEVGVNISADHLVCDLTPFDSMVQRFGRVNRFGNRDDTRIDIVYPKTVNEKDQYELRRARTLELLKQLNGHGSPAALNKLDPNQRQDAFSPQPTILPVSDILFDAWALTTIRDKLPGRPPVEPYLHGISDSDPPETHVAWREEVWELDPRREKKNAPLFRDREERREFEKYSEVLLEDYPLKPHELLRDSTFRKNTGVQATLSRLADGRGHLPVWIQDLDGSISVMTLADLAETELVSRAVILPPQAGGLSNGMLTADPHDSERKDYDVADEWRDENGNRRRVRVWKDDPEYDAKTVGMRFIREIVFKNDEDEDAEGRSWHWYELPASADSDGSKTAKERVTWLVHTKDVTDNTERIVKVLDLSKELQEAVILAAEFHDLGKKRDLWQRSIGHQLPINPKPEDWLAKSGGKMKPRELTDYRHEFGSLIDVENEPRFQRLSGDMKDLVRHLIAAHHGRGRPHFPLDEAFDPEPNGKEVSIIAAEVPQRYARLQRKYGRWGLAYLESLLRAADYAASAKPSTTGEGHP